MTYRELVYMCMDELRLHSDDSTFTEDHILFLLNKTRPFLLKQRYSDIRKQIPESNYQTVCLKLMQVPAIAGEPCEGGAFLRSVEKVPFLMQIGIPRVYPGSYYLGEIAYVSRDRMRYVGHNKYLKNIIYCSLGPDNYLYFKSSNPQYLYLEEVNFTGIFQDAHKASEMQCNGEEEDTCDIMDKVFPLEDALVQPILEIIVKELSPSIYRPTDEENNANDDLANKVSER